MPRLPQQSGLLSSHHHPSNPIATEKSRTASTRFDLPVCTLVINTLKTFQQGTLLHESHPRWHSCMCKKKVETSTSTAQDSTGQGQVFCQLIATMGMSQKKYLPGQVVDFFFSFSLNTKFDFFSPLRRAEVETGGLSVLYLRVDCRSRSCENGECKGLPGSRCRKLRLVRSSTYLMHRLWRVNLRFKDFSDPMSLALG